MYVAKLKKIDEKWVLGRMGCMGDMHLSGWVGNASKGSGGRDARVLRWGRGSMRLEGGGGKHACGRGGGEACEWSGGRGACVWKGGEGSMCVEGGMRCME